MNKIVGGVPYPLHIIFFKFREELDTPSMMHNYCQFIANVM